MRGLPKYFTVWVTRPSRAVLAGLSANSGGGKIVQTAEHLADHGAALVADQVKHVAD